MFENPNSYQYKNKKLNKRDYLFSISPTKKRIPKRLTSKSYMSTFNDVLGGRK